MQKLKALEYKRVFGISFNLNTDFEIDITIIRRSLISGHIKDLLIYLGRFLHKAVNIK